MLSLKLQSQAEALYHLSVRYYSVSAGICESKKHDTRTLARNCSQRRWNCGPFRQWEVLPSRRWWWWQIAIAFVAPDYSQEPKDW